MQIEKIGSKHASKSSKENLFLEINCINLKYLRNGYDFANTTRTWTKLPPKEVNSQDLFENMEIKEI